MTQSAAHPYSAFLIDIDGTVLEGRRVLAGAPELLEYARSGGRRFVFVSNNSRDWPRDVAASLTRLGLDCDENEVLTAGHLAAGRAAARSQRGIYVLGSESLGEMVLAAGGRLVTDGADVVLVGLDRSLSYDRLSLACRDLGAGASMIAVNRDLSNPTEAGLEPGAGALVRAMRSYTRGRILSCGKPSPVLAHEARRRLRSRREEMLMIGDSLDSDMRMARRAQIAGALVETGVASHERSRRAPAGVTTFASLGDLLGWLKG